MVTEGRNAPPDGIVMNIGRGKGRLMGKRASLRHQMDMIEGIIPKGLGGGIILGGLRGLRGLGEGITIKGRNKGMTSIQETNIIMAAQGGIKVAVPHQEESPCPSPPWIWPQ